MKTRFVVALSGILIIPSISFAGIPTVDGLGTQPAVIETTQTAADTQENASQLITMQKTMAKIGSAKTSISSFINDQKDAIAKYKEKMDNYIKTAKEYKEKALAYKAEVEKYANIAMEVNEKGLDGYLKDNAGSLAGDALDKLGIEGVDASKVEKFTNQAVSGDFKGLAGGMMGEVAGSVGLDATKAESFTNQAVSGDLKGLAGGMMGEVAGSVGLDATKAESFTNQAVSGDLKGLAGGVIGETAGSVGLDATKAQGFANQAMNSVSKKENNKLATAPTVSSTRKAGGFSTKVPAKASYSPATVSAMAPTTATMGTMIDLQATKASVAPSIESSTMTVAGKAKADAEIAKAMKATSAPTNKGEVDEGIDKAEALTEKATVDAEKVKALAEKAKAGVEKADTEKTKASVEKVTSAANSVIKAKAVSEKKLKTETKVIKGLEEVKTKQTPQRAKFKTSFGYGRLQNKYQLSFASLSGDTKTGETAEGILIVPESISMHCDINYEEAIKDNKMEDCLREINTIVTSAVTEEITKKEIDDATTDIQNGYVELLTSSYFTALDIYNESLTFKGNKLDPVTTTSTNDIDASWRVAKEMHLVLGDRIVRLQKVWASVLAAKMYEQFINERYSSAK